MLIGMMVFCAISLKHPELNHVVVKEYTLVNQGQQAVLLVESIYTSRKFIIDMNRCREYPKAE